MPRITSGKGKSKQDYETPKEFIEAVESRFGKISFDLASKNNNISSNYFTKEENSLLADWSDKGDLLWLNPPFENISLWASKCVKTIIESKNENIRILMLIPVGITNYFIKYIIPNANIWFLKGRIKFVGCDDFYPKDLMICDFCKKTNGITGDILIWDWKENKIVYKI